MIASGGRKVETEEHRWIRRDYRPHSNFVIIRPGMEKEVRAALMLTGRVCMYSGGRLQGSNQGVVLLRNALRADELRVFYQDSAFEWVLTKVGIELLGL